MAKMHTNVLNLTAYLENAKTTMSYSYMPIRMAKFLKDSEGQRKANIYQG